MKLTKPQISILIPTRNRQDRLIKTLQSLSQQSAAADICEVLVVSDGSTDGTKEIVERLAESAEWAGRRLICVEQEWKGAAAARNTALRLAVGELVLFLDDDVIAAPDLVAAHLSCHKAHEADATSPGMVVLGKIEPGERPEAMHRQMRLWWLDHYRRLEQHAPLFTAFFTGNVSLPREAALQAGRFDESIDYGEDIEFGYRLGILGLDFKYEPRARAYTSNLKSGEGLLRDMYRLGRGNVRIYHKFRNTLPSLPLSAYGETNLRMRLVRGLMLKISRNRTLERMLDRGFAMWAERRKVSRLDRQMFELTRSYYFWTGARAEIQDKTEWSKLTSPGAPVLTYHSVAPQKEGRGTNRYSVDERSFSRQMFLLRLLGYQVVSLESLVDTWQKGQLPAPRSIAITFDDGYRDNLLHAWPVLHRFGYAATLFFVTGLAGETSIWDQGVEDGPKPLLTYQELRELDRHGFRVEAHTVNHADLPAVSPQIAEAEIKESRQHLEANLGRPVSMFAYPYGHHNNYIEEMVESAGYKAAFSVRRGLNTLRTARFALKRVTISGDDSLAMFALKVITGDDPLRYISGFQRITDRKHREKRKLLMGKGEII